MIHVTVQIVSVRAPRIQRIFGPEINSQYKLGPKYWVLGQGLIFPVRIKSLRFGPDGAPQGLKFSKTQKSKTR